MGFLFALFVIGLILYFIVQALKSVGNWLLNIIAFIIMICLYALPFVLVFGFSYYALSEIDIEENALLIASGVFTLLTHVSKSGSLYTLSSAIVCYICSIIYDYVPGLENSWVFLIAAAGMIILVPIIMHISYLNNKSMNNLPRIFYFIEKVPFICPLLNLLSYLTSTAMLLIWCYIAVS